MEKLVIDISYYQDPAEIDYDELSKHIDGAILRCSYTGTGTGDRCYVDEMFETHYRELHKRGVPIGVYHYSCANTAAEGRAEAEFVLHQIADKELLYPVYWDTEDSVHQQPSSAADVTAAGVAFCSRIEEAGYYAGVYTAPYWAEHEVEMAQLARFDLWIANYDVPRPYYDGPYGMWQYTSDDTLPGYAGRLDLNKCYVDYPAIIKKAGLNRQNNIRFEKPVVKVSGEKLEVDGYLGPKTISALQRYLGTPVDGVLSEPSLMVMELQKRLNAGKF